MTTSHEVSELVQAAVTAAATTQHAAPETRAGWLEAVAEAIADAGEELVPIGHRETGIAADRLRGEVERTAGQLRLFAEVCREGSFLEVTIDRPDPAARPLPSPDVRRMLAGLGPVAVFSASNFPFAFSVAGGDTASALAAGCPVIVKAHSGHPELSDATAQVVAAALAKAGAPDGIFALIHGTQAGRDLVQAPGITAVGFTGSLGGGRALFDLCAARPDPIPFYGELGSLNPVFVTEAAATAGADEVAAGFVASMTVSAGQLCTKPGLLFVPAGSGMAERAAALAGEVVIGRLLNDRITAGFEEAVGKLTAVPGVRRAAESVPDRPTLLVTDADTLLARHGDLLVEAFGPGSLIVEYADETTLPALAAALPASLTGAVFATEDDAILGPLTAVLREKSGRLIFNGWPTGVAVTWGMHHGGPYPATTSSLHTSVGATAIRRWLRPVVFQNWPQNLLPAALRDDASGPRRVDGVLHP